MLVIDLQGFFIPHFIPKEMAITNGEHTSHFIFKPPCPLYELPQHFQVNVKHLTKTFHGIRWHTGFVDLENMDSILQHVGERDNTIFCKGKVIADYLRNHTRLRVVDLNDNETFDVDIPTLQPWKPSCFAHTLHTCRCSLNNVNVLYSYLTNNMLQNTV